MADLDPLVVTFSEQLNRQLDLHNVPRGSARNNYLQELTGLSQTQVFRMLSGRNFASLDTLVQLQRAGVKVGEIFRGFGGGTPTEESAAADGEEGWFYDGDNVYLVSVVLGNRQTGPYRAYRQDGKLYVCVASNLPADDALAVHGVTAITFKDSLPSLALVDDDPVTLSALQMVLSESFVISTYQSGVEFLGALSGKKRFDGFIIDWRLGDMTGETVIDLIRQRTQAPIIVLTGAVVDDVKSGVSEAIGKHGVIFSQKPADPAILKAMLMRGIVPRPDPLRNDRRMHPR